MAKNLNKLFNKFNRIIGVIGSDTKFDVYRPDYTSSNQVGSLIATGMPCRLDTRAQQFAEPALQGGMYYDIFLNRTLVKPGDILVPTGFSPTASSTPTTSIVTIGSITGLKPCVGVLSDAIGHIADDVNTVLYNNVRWQWASPGQPKAGLHRELEASMPFDRRKCVMYRRQNIGLPIPITKQMRLVEYIDGTEYRWRIVDILSLGNYTTMQLEDDAN